MSKISFPQNVSTFAFCGDWHGNSFYASEILRQVARSKAEVLIHVGDFGVWREDLQYLDHLNTLCEKNGLFLMFIDGNHEDHVELLSIPVDDDGVRRVRSHVWHLPRGFRWEWNNVKFLALGGAHSVDKNNRTEGFDWFPEEEITWAQAEEVIESGEADVMFTHDCPAGVNIPSIQTNENVHTNNFFPEAEVIASEQHRDLLREIVNEVKPRFLWCGHYHIFFNTDLAIDNEHICHVQILDKDDTPDFNKNTQMVEVADLLN